MASWLRAGCWLLAGALVVAAGAALAQGLPGLGQDAAPAAEPGWLQRAYAWLLMQQAALHRELIGIMRALKAGEPGALFGLIGGSFLYGVLHALGPGHGKLIISSYAFASGSGLRSSLLLTLVSSLTQAASAILLILALVVILGQANLAASRSTYWLELGSYALILLLGVAMLVRALTGRRGCCGGHAHHEHAGGERGHHRHDEGERIPTRDFWAMVFSIGVRPCSGAVIVLLFTMGQGLFLEGVTATIAMALGTALAVGGLAVAAILVRRGGLHLAPAGSAASARLGQAFAVAGASAVVFLGSMMLWAAWQLPPTY